MWEIIRRIACSICNAPETEQPKPEIDIYETDTAKVRELLAESNIELLYGLLDNKYYFTNFEDWGKIFHYIYTVEEIPIYLPNKFDCDKWAMWLRIMVAFHFGLNLFALIIGDAPYKGKIYRHGFNLFYAENGLWLWEPQEVNNAEPFRIGERGYSPKFALI